MKKVNKLASFMLVLAMLLSLSATAFAADYAEVPVSSISVTLKVTNAKGGTFNDVTVNVPDGTSIYTLLTQYNNLPDKQHWTVDGSTYGESWFMDSMTYGGETYKTEPCETQPPIWDKEEEEYVTCKEWKNGYGLIYDDHGYKYCYAGYAWMYTIDGDTHGQNINELALNQFKLHAGNTVNLDYKIQTEVWTQDEPLDPNPFA